MFRFLLFFKGYLLVEISGYATERFINLCKLKNIYLWDLKAYHGKFSVKMKVSDFDRLEEIKLKTNVKVDILKKYGLPFFFQKRKSRIFYLLFLLFAIILIFVSNLFVWKIEFDGNQTVTNEQLEDFLHQYKVDIGCQKSKVAFEKIEKSLRKEFSTIKWCSVAIKGNTLYVSIKENLLSGYEETDINTKNGYTDIVAAEDGVVEKLMIRNGVACVKIGDNVTKGQVLVTGLVPVYDDNMEVKTYHYYNADADVLLKTTMIYEENIKDTYSKKEYTGRIKKIDYIKIFNKDIHLPFKVPYAYYDIFSSSNRLILFKTLKLPVYYGAYEAREYFFIEQKYSNEEIVEIANEKLKKYYKSLSQKGVQILQKDVKIEYNANNWVISGIFVVYITKMETIYKEQVENILE